MWIFYVRVKTRKWETKMAC